MKLFQRRRERVGGKSHAMVAHLVHESADGKRAVAAVLLDTGGATALVGSRAKRERPARACFM